MVRAARIAAQALVLPLVLAGCQQHGATQDGEAIYCSLAGAKEFKPDCVLERTMIDGKATLVIRHPDGAFHRLEVSGDGQNLLAADGADVTQSARKQDRFEVILGQDRYVVPVAAPAPANAAGDAGPR